MKSVEEKRNGDRKNEWKNCKENVEHFPFADAGDFGEGESDEGGG